MSEAHRPRRLLRSIGALFAGFLAVVVLHAPMKHALAGGVVGLVLSTAGAVTTGDRGPDFGPHWYPLALVATAMPCAWAGGQLRVRQLREDRR
jgi:hypothetical protein